MLDVEAVDDQLMGGRLGRDEPGRDNRAGKQLAVAEAGRLHINDTRLQDEQGILAHAPNDQSV